MNFKKNFIEAVHLQLVVLWSWFQNHDQTMTMTMVHGKLNFFKYFL